MNRLSRAVLGLSLAVGLAASPLAPAASAADAPAMSRDLVRGSRLGVIRFGANRTGTDADLTGFARGGKDRIGDGGADLGWEMMYHPSPRFGVGFDLGLTARGEKESTSVVQNANSTIKSDTLAFFLQGRYVFIPTGTVQPFVGAGLGLHSTSMKIVSTPVPGAPWADTGTAEGRTLVKDSTGGLALRLRVGSDVYLHERAFMGLEAAFTHFGGRKFQTTAEAQRVGLNAIDGSVGGATFAARLGWRF